MIPTFAPFNFALQNVALDRRVDQARSYFDKLRSAGFSPIFWQSGSDKFGKARHILRVQVRQVIQ